MVVRLIVCALATWRLTNIIEQEEIGEPLRKIAGEYENDLGGLSYPDTFLGKLFGCFWCLSVWVGGIVTIMSEINLLLMYPFALSTLAIALRELWQEQIQSP